MKKRTMLWLCAVVAIVLSCTGCGGNKGSNGASGASQNDAADASNGAKEGLPKAEGALKMGVMASMDYLPYLTAAEKGVYDSLGLEVEFVTFFSPNERDAAFRSGQIEGTIIDYSGAAIQQSGGISLGLIAAHDGFFELLADPSVTSVSALRGKKVGISRNTVIEYALDRMISAQGLPEDAVRKTEVNKIPVRLEMLLSGDLAAGIFPDPFLSIGKARGLRSLCSTKDLGISVTGTMMSGEALEKKGNAVRLLLIGYNKGVDILLHEPRSSWRKVLTDGVKVPEELADTIELPLFRYAQMPSEQDIKATLEWLHVRKLIPETYNGEGLLRSEFLPIP